MASEPLSPYSRHSFYRGILRAGVSFANRLADSVMRPFSGKPLGHVHLFTAGLGDLLLLAPYYHSVFTRFPCDRVLVVSPYMVPMFRALLPGVRVAAINVRRIRLDPFYRRSMFGPPGMENLSVFCYVDEYWNDTLLLSGSRRFTIAALRETGELPPFPNGDIIRNPKAPLGHFAEYGRLYCGHLWKLQAHGEAPSFRDGPSDYRRLLEDIFPERISDYVSTGERYVCISNTPTRQYRAMPAVFWQEVAAAIPNNVKILHLGGSTLPISHPRYVDLGGKTSLGDAMSLVRGASLFLGVETGLLHAAYMFGVKTVCVLGGGHFGHYLPWPGFEGNLRCVFVDMPCRACDWKCPDVSLERDERPPCLARISPSMVVSAARELGAI